MGVNGIQRVCRKMKARKDLLGPETERYGSKINQRALKPRDQQILLVLKPERDLVFGPSTRFSH